jgi:tetratricopeptide (TPR) repeat protein
MSDVTENNQQETILNLCNQAAEYVRVGNADEAIKHLVEAFNLAQSISNARLTAYVLNAMGHAYVQIGNIERAEDCFNTALKRAGSDNPDLSLMAQSGLGRAAQSKGDAMAAANHLSQAAALAKTAGNHQMEATLMNDAGDMLLADGQPKNARKAYQNALDAARTARNTDHEATALVGIASATQRIDGEDTAAAIQAALSALGKATDDAVRDRLRTQVRDLLKASGRSEVLIPLDLDLADAEAMGDTPRMITIHTKIAQVLMDAKKIEAAQDRLNVARELAQTSRDLAAESRIMGLMGDLSVKSGFAYMAYGQYEEQVALAKESRNRELEIDALMNLAAAHEAGGNPRNAIETIQKAITLAKISVNAKLEAGMVFQQAKLHLALGDITSALELLERVKKLLANGANPDLLREVEVLIAQNRTVSNSGSMSSRFTSGR